VEQNEKSITASLEISDNEQDIKEGGRRIKSYLCYSIGIYIIHKEVLKKQKEQVDKICKIIN
jgi:hypothetical protein